LRLTGKLDLADVRRTVKLTNMSELAGRLDANGAVRTRMAVIDRKQYDRVVARGTLDVRDLAVKSADLPHALAISEASLELTPQRADLRSLTGRIGSADVRPSRQSPTLIPFGVA